MNDEPSHRHRVRVDPLMASLVPGYFQSRRRDAARMRIEIAEGNLEVVSVIAHKMKGSGTSYGSPEVSDLGRRIEAAIHRGAEGEALVLIGELEQYLADLELVFEGDGPPESGAP